MIEVFNYRGIDYKFCGDSSFGIVASLGRHVLMIDENGWERRDDRQGISPELASILIVAFEKMLDDRGI